MTGARAPHGRRRQRPNDDNDDDDDILLSSYHVATPSHCIVSRVAFRGVILRSLVIINELFYN